MIAKTAIGHSRANAIRPGLSTGSEVAVRAPASTSPDLLGGAPARPSQRPPDGGDGATSRGDDRAPCRRLSCAAARTAIAPERRGRAADQQHGEPAEGR